MVECRICSRRVLSHAYQMTCSLCSGVIHLKCLPFIDRNDPIYVDRNTNIWFCTVCTKHLFPFNHYDDDNDYDQAIFDISKMYSCKMSIQELRNRVFVPFHFNEDIRTPLVESDPDIQYFLGAISNNLNSCDYYIEDTFNDRCETLPINRCSLSILHLNIRSIPRNLSSLQTYLNNLDIQFSVIGISETWLKPYNVDCYGMDGYKEEHLYRSERMGGGVSLYVMNGIEYFVRNDMSIIDEHLESLFIEVDKSCLSNENNSLIGVIYRPPNTDIDIFINHLMTILDKIKLENKSCHLMGDFNINLLNAESHSKTGNFLDILASYSLMPNITKPTRATEETSTLIDNIFCDNIKENLNSISGILYTDISDHFPIFYIDYSSSVDNTEQFATRRLYSETNKKKFCKQISEYNWDNVLLCTDSQESFSTFHKEFSYIYNSCFPSKILKLNYRNRKIWLTNGMKESIKIKKQTL